MHAIRLALGLEDAEKKNVVTRGKSLATIKITDDEKREIKLEEYVPFMLETELRKRGGIFQAKANWTTNVVSDKRLITGQNPGSAAEVGEAIVKLIKTNV